MSQSNTIKKNKLLIIIISAVLIIVAFFLFLLIPKVQSAALGGHRCVSPAATLRSQRPPLLGGRFRFNHNSKMLRRPFQNGISRNLVIHNHRAPALRVSLRAGEGAKFHLAAFFQNLK